MTEGDNEIKEKKSLLKLLIAGFTLTKRELEVFVLLAKGKKNKEIGDTLHISYHTARFHRANIYKKFSVNNKFALGKIAQEMGLM